MKEKLIALCRKYWEPLSFVFFGGLTTVVNFLVYYPLYNLAGLSATASNIPAWAVAVAFAFVTNKPFVHRSRDWSRKVVLPELAKFVGCRVASGALETALMGLTVDILHWNGNGMKVAVSVLVVIMNYLGGKLLVFRKKQ